MPFYPMCLKKQTEDDCCDDIPYHEFQVANSTGEKWKANKNQVNQEVSLSMSVGKPQFWRFEREENEPLWSFHVLSKTGEKLYLSYDANNNDITLEFKGVGGKKRLFVALVHENGFHFRAHGRENRYIGSDANGKLGMFTTENPQQDLVWLVREDFTHIESGGQVLVVEIMQFSRKWICTDARSDQQILVQQNGNTEPWYLTTNPGKWTFSPYYQASLYASSTTTSSNTVLFEGLLGRADLTEYFHQPVSGLYQLQNLYSGNWIGVVDEGQTYLNLGEQRMAVSWDIQTASLPYTRNNKTFFFPHVRIPTVVRNVSKKINSKNLEKNVSQEMNSGNLVSNSLI